MTETIQQEKKREKVNMKSNVLFLSDATWECVYTTLEFHNFINRRHILVMLPNYS